MIRNYFGNLFISVGKQMQRAGNVLRGFELEVVNDKLACNHRRLLNFYEKKPSVGQGAWIAPNASVIGGVKIGPKSSIWYGAVLRGDVNDIQIGSESSIGDRTVIHVNSGFGNIEKAKPTIIGDNVTIESGSILHACTLKDGCKVESGATILDGAIVESKAVVGTGSLVTMDKLIPSGEYWAGNPAKFVRKLTPTELEQLKELPMKYKGLADKHNYQTSKSREQVAEDKFYLNNFTDANPEPLAEPRKP